MEKIIKKGLVQIVFDPQKSKPRALVVNTGLWTRFPNKLRELGAVYQVEELRLSGSSYIAVGNINKVG